MMNRNSSKDSGIGIGARNLNTNGIRSSPVTGLLSHRRVMSLTSTKTTTAEDLNSNNNSNADPFSRNRRSLSVASSDESDLQVRLGRLTAGSTKAAKNVFDDPLSSNEDGKHDYDWLLAPPGTSLIPSSDGKESQPTSVAPKRNTLVRSGSTVKTSRLSVSQSESNQTSRPSRSSSVTRPSISTTQYTNYNKNSNILNTSSASVTSYIRPSTPINRSSPAARPSAISSRATTSRASTPSRHRPSSTTTSIDRTTRPSTPTHRPQTPAKLTSPTAQPSSRPSTPTRRSPTLSYAPSPNGRSTGPTSRPSSPGPPGSRIRPSPQSINHPDFPHETPPNLRTTLPARPLSAGRSRPGAAMTVNVGSMTRRQPLPIVTRGRITEPPGKGRPHGNGHVVETLESRRTLHVPESITRKPIKTLNSESGKGFGRSISKKSLDMAIKHMDIRNGGVHPFSGSKLYPQSIQSGNQRIQPSCASNVSGSINGSFSNFVNSKNGNLNNSKIGDLNNSKNGNLNYGYSENKVKPISVEHRSSYSSKITEMDTYESSRYGAILLKEDLKNTSWLHSADEIGDQGPLFDNGFESLPEPISPL